MFSYRHAFHAGNHADVLKHIIFAYILDYFKQKETPFWVIDSHAGVGAYQLDGQWAQQSNELETGISKIIKTSNPPQPVQHYIEIISAYNQNQGISLYPGSPSIAYQALRPHDKLFLFELLEQDYTDLKNLFTRQYKANHRQVKINCSDGFNGLLGLLPPQPKRAIILIDPPYENKNDYKLLTNTIKAALKKFPTGCYAIWHPLVQRIQANELQHNLRKLPVKWLHASLSVKQPSSNGLGMHGSGMFVINPPWQLPQALATTIPFLLQTLAQDNKATYSLDSSEL